MIFISQRLSRVRRLWRVSTRHVTAAHFGSNLWPFNGLCPNFFQIFTLPFSFQLFSRASAQTWQRIRDTDSFLHIKSSSHLAVRCWILSSTKIRGVSEHEGYPGTAIGQYPTAISVRTMVFSDEICGLLNFSDKGKGISIIFHPWPLFSSFSVGYYGLAKKLGYLVVAKYHGESIITFPTRTAILG